MLCNYLPWELKYFILNSTSKSILNSAMNNILTAQELKTKGAQIIQEKIKDFQEVVISVRGKNTYVVMTMDKYNYLRKCELEAAILETKNDLARGKYKKQTVKEHLKDLRNV